MNVKDIFNVETPEGDRLVAMFNRQRELFVKYHHIEDRNGIGLGLPGLDKDRFSLDDHRWQYVLKDYSWRITEELAESVEAWGAFAGTRKDGVGQQERQEHLLHCYEEVSDAVHFFIELLLNLGYNGEQFSLELVGDQEMHFPVDRDYIDFLFITEGQREKELHPLVPEGSSSISSNFFRTVYHLGLAMNCLKNKPWKLTHVPTDEKKFREYIRKAFKCLIAFSASVGLTPESFCDMYFRKSKVNQSRQESNY